MMTKTYIGLLASVLLLSACSEDENTLAEEKEARLVPVTLTLRAADVAGNTTRSASALLPECENWIYDYYFVQYNSSGISLTSGHRRTDVTTGDLEVTDNIWLYNASGCTICLVANIRPSGFTITPPSWAGDSYPSFPDNLPTFKTWKLDMADHIAAAEAGTLKFMPMCGYWEGDVSGSTESAPTAITCTLGRMIARINLALTNSSGSSISGITMNNIATKAYLYPQVNNTALESTDYTNISNTFTLANNASTTRFFYSAPNYPASSSYATTLVVGSNSLPLGNDVDNSDYNLYMNTIYSFNITLK
ncbi:MAG: DUF4906 domain-containing protein [Prevotella sp.]|nr:DUF4906 domain-containing protein [Prevotella sp.]